jgi:hypothetical protein
LSAEQLIKRLRKISFKCRVKSLEGIAQVFPVEMRVNFRSGYTFMSQHFLHGAQIGASFYQVSSK